jgi:RHS repeat-associated protein
MVLNNTIYTYARVLFVLVFLSTYINQAKAQCGLLNSNVSGGGYINGTTPSVNVVLAPSSQSGISYQLRRNGSAYASKTGTGGTLVFNVVSDGVYTIYGMSGSCEQKMNGSATVQNGIPPDEGCSVNVQISSSGQPINVCPGSITLTATGGSNYLWIIPGGGTSVSNSIVVQTGGTYKLEGTNPCGTRQTSTLPVTINTTIPTVEFTAGPTTICEGTTSSQFTASSNGGNMTYGISNAGSSIINTNSGIVTWDPSFVGTATIIASASGCSGQVSAVRNVTKIMKPISYFLDGGGTTCGSSNPVLLTVAYSSQQGVLYELLRDNAPSGYPLQYGNNSTLHWNVYGTGTYTVKASNVCGEKILAGIAVVSADTEVHATVTATGSGCSTTLVASGGTSYDWSGPGSNTTISTGASIQPKLGGTYSVKVSNVCGFSKELNYTISSIGSINILTSSPPVNTCPGKVTLTRDGGNSTYQWTKPNGEKSAAQYLAADQAGTYNLSGTNDCGLQENRNVTVSFKPLNNTQPITQDIKIKYNEKATLTATGGGVSQYKWYDALGNALEGNITPNLTTSTIYYATSYRPDVSECESSKVPLYVTVNRLPVVQASGNQNVILPNDHIVLMAYCFDPDGDALTYFWTQESGPECTLAGRSMQELSVSNLKPGTYKFKITARDGLDEASGTTTVVVTVLPNNYNHIRSTTVLVPGKTTEGDLLSLPVEQKNVSFTYFDGLGRPIQNVSVQGSPSKRDIIQPIVYDEFGRETKKYLAYEDDGIANGWYKENALQDPEVTTSDEQTRYHSGKQYAFYQAGGDIAKDAYPLSKTLMEPSPLNRVVKQGAPGEAWQPNESLYDNPTDHSIKLAHDVNTNDEVLLWTWYESSASSFGLVHAGAGSNRKYYNPGELTKSKIKDEQNHEVIEFSDKNGKKILRKHQVSGSVYTAIYYIYDDAGNLMVTLQPEGVKRLNDEYFSKNEAEKDTFLQMWAFRYKYDTRNRKIMSQIPGAGPVYMIYDNRDRVVMSQDAEQRKNITWMFIKYDVLNRPVLTGKYQHAGGLDAIQADVNTFYEALDNTKAWNETYTGSADGNVLGYTNKSYPQVSNAADYLSATYYDSYDQFSTPNAYAYVNESLPGQEAIHSQATQGLVIAMMTKILGTTTWLRTVNYYDAKHRSIQAVADHQKGMIRVSTVYDFAGRVRNTKRTYMVNNTTNTVNEKYTYDHVSRLKSVKHSVNNAPEVMLLENTYNALGQLVTKKLHSTDDGASFKQSVDYRYNIRGWMDKINNPDTDEPDDLFSMALNYNSPSDNGGEAQYNGNISEVIWKTAGTDKQSYGYSYDALNRLLEARYYDVVHSLQNGRFTEKINGYDLNGNIMGITRNGKRDGTITPYGLMDELTYTYKGNQVTRIDDGVDKHIAEGGFKEETREDDEQIYNDNGNLQVDKNKQIIAIDYNHLNLVHKVTKANGDYATYMYDAGGRKLAQQVFGTSPKQTDYIGECVFENDVLQFISHAEGRVVMTGDPEYQYTLKDHLGNIRLTFTAKTEEESATATFENENATLERGKFLRYETSRNVHSSLFDRTNGLEHGYAERLNGSENEKYGLAKSLSVMPGDVVKLEVYAKYVDTDHENITTALQQFLAAVASNTAGPGTVIDGAGYASSTASFPYTTLLNTAESSGNGPKAFLNWLVFDKNFKFINGGYQRMSDVAKEQGQDVPHEKLSATIPIAQAGYVYVYLSNEESSPVEVFFDDLNVTHVKSPVIQTNDYYAFGLAFNSYNRESSVKQDYLYNGKELQTELDLGWLDYGARMYDPFIGRWMAVDPMAEVYRRLSPYNYVANNPMRFIDPDGMQLSAPDNHEGMYINSKYDEDGIYLPVYERETRYTYESQLKNEEKSKKEKSNNENAEEETQNKNSVEAGNGGPGDPPGSGSTSLVELYLRMVFRLPDAISLGGQLESVLPLGGGTIEQGKLYVLNGSSRGKSSWYLDSGIGAGVDGGIALNVSEYYYVNLSGKPYNFTIADHNGPRFAMSADVNIYGVLSVGAGFTVAPVLGWDGGVYIISRSTAVGIGIEGSPVSGNVNYGNTKLDH